LAEHVAESGTGRAYRSRDEFDAAINALATLSPNERQEQSRRARDYAVKRYSRERVRERLVAEVRAVVGQPQ
jgi:glycosyltransferase involved in cell wall biosynthesis